MNLTAEKSTFLNALNQFNPENNMLDRTLALYAAALTLGCSDTLDKAVQLGQKNEINFEQFYEIVLQSYLFLGFPRMLIAAQNLNTHFDSANIVRKESQSDDFKQWHQRGEELCKKVYGSNYDLLKKKVNSFAPEIFQWMILEGYGKVLSRDCLSIQTRELAIIAFLTMENRPQQLHSHIKGAYNVGLKKVQIKEVIDDIGAAAGDGYKTAIRLLESID